MTKAMKNFILKAGAASVALLIASPVMADVTMSIIDPNSGAPGNKFCEYAGLSASLNGSPIIDGGEWIGIYSFTVQGNEGNDISTPFYTTCIRPNGRLYDEQYTYNTLSFHDASPGMNPKGWASSGSDYWGIQNANYLFQEYSSGIVKGTSGLSGSGPDQGAALALAMYAALYDSQGYGKNWEPTTTTRTFTLNGANAYVMADYKAILDALKSWNPTTSADFANGYVLRPTDPSAQDMLLLGAMSPHGGGTPVPEPTTMIAGIGALGLLLFGVGVHSKRSVLRIGK